jgi:DNA-directed RNA polymerase I subunit RPA12
MSSFKNPISLWNKEAPFCPTCGTLLVLPDFGSVKCDHCPYSVPLENLPRVEIITRSYPRPEPEWLQEYRAQQAAIASRLAGGKAIEGDGRNGAIQRATINEECPKCKAPSMEYYTMQLRSADEGQTVFYECAGKNGCGHKFSLNT